MDGNANYDQITEFKGYQGGGEGKGHGVETAMIHQDGLSWRATNCWFGG
jgi:hypothetical protein